MSELEKQLKEYLNTNVYNYAFLINGQWGSGKTHFIKKFIKDNNESKIFLNISLNGLENIEDIDIQIIEELIKHLGKGVLESINLKDIRKQVKSKNIMSLINKDFPNVILSVVLDLITDKLDNKNVVLIFDDLERCNIEIKKLLAYINDYIEKQELKVIIIANEKEMEEKDEYIKIKEKFIGHSIEFIPNIKNNYLTFIEKLEDDKLKNILIRNVEYLIFELEEQKHLNMRTVQFIIDKFINLYNMILKDSEFDDDIDVTEYIFKYITYISIVYKKGENLYKKWKNNEYGYINLKEDDNFNNYRYGFKFIDLYITKGILNSEQILETLKRFKKSLSIKEGPYDRLRNNYWEMEDEEVYNGINELKENFRNNTYNTNNILNSLMLLLKLEDIGYKIELEDFMNVFKKTIDNDSSNDCLHFAINFVDFSNASEDITKKYSNIVKEIKKYVLKTKFGKIEEYIQTKNFKMLFEEMQTNETYFNYIAINGFFSNINMDEFINNLENTESVIELAYFKYFCNKLFQDLRYIENFDKELDCINKLIEKLKQLKIEDNIGKSNIIKAIIEECELFIKNNLKQ